MWTEGVCPAFWRHLIDEAVWVRGDADEDILQVGKGRNVDEFAALDKGIEEPGATSALETAKQQPILPTDGDDTELVLRALVIDGRATIVDEALERQPLIGEIADGIAGGRFR